MSQFLEELLRPWRDELAAIVARGVREGTFAPPVAIDDFTLRFAALLDGLAILRLRQMHQPSRKRLIGLAMTAARAELAVDAVAAPADLCRGPGGHGTVPDSAWKGTARGVCYVVSYFGRRRW